VGESADASQAETTITTLSLAVVLERQLRRMDAPVARALEVMSVAGGPLDEKIVYAAAEFGADLLAARSAMLSTRLARAATAAKASFGTAFDTAINLAINPAFRTAFNLDLYHARVRSALLSQLPPERKHEIHLAIAQALEESGAADYERMLVHFRGAGDREKVALYARSAADRAAKLLAFEHAARLYREALEVARERPDPQSTSTVGELWQLLAGALAHAGRGREAAEAYFAAAAAGPSGSGSRPDESESLRLQIRGTEQLLISGHNAEGLSRLGEILPRIGVPCPTSRWRIEASITWNRMRTRIGMRRGIGRNRTGQEHELQMDACWSGALGVAMVDPRRSAEFCARHLAWALESDDPNRISAALAAEAVHSLGDRWRAADPDTLLTEARRMSISVPGRQSEAFVACMSAIVAGLRGRWRDSLNFARRVLTRGRESSDSNVKPVRESGSVLRLEGATGTGSGLRLGGAGWERDTAVIFSLIAKVMLGEWTSAARTLTEMTNEARDRGNRYGLVNFRLLTAGYVTRLAADQPEQALQEVRELIAMWDSPAPSRRSSPDSPRFDLQRYFATVWEADVALYSGKGEEAWAVNEAAWPLVRRSDLLRLQILRISAAFVRGKCAVAAAAADSAGSARRAAMLRQAGKARDMLAREDTGLAIALAALLSACIAATSQQYDRMAADLANAESLLTQAEMIPWAAAVRYRRAQWDPAMEPASGESDWMRDQRIVNPQRLVNFLMPGDWSK
jgi:hypothetical protein